MKHENETILSELSNEHERLCAYVLGEGTPAERADVERDLLRSPELRAEHDRIARTIHCVQDAIRTGETLSPEATQTLVTAAHVAKPAAWHAVPWLRIAAGLGAVALGLTLVQRAGDRVTTGSSGLELARSSTRSEGVDVQGVRRPFQPTDPASNRVSSQDVAKLSDQETPEQEKLLRGASRATEARKPSGGVSELRDEANVDYRGLDAVQQPEPKVELGFVAQAPGEAQPAAGNEDLSAVRTITAPGSADVPGLRSGRSDKDGAPKNAPGDASLSRKNSSDLSFHEETVAQDTRLGAGGSTTTGTPVVFQRGGDAGDGLAKAAGEKSKADDKSSGSPRPFAKRGLDTSGTPAAAAPSGPTTGGTYAGVPPAATESKKAPASAATPGIAIGAGGRGSRPSGPATGAPSGPVSGGPNGPEGSSRRAAGTGVWDAVELVEKDRDGAAKDDTAVRERLGLVGYVSNEEEAPLIPYYRLAPADQQVYLDRECRRILVDCRPRPNERPRDMYFRFWGDNPFEVAALDAQSTFAADVDTASYALARRYVQEGNVPEKAQIRTEEFVNYFGADVPAPTNGVFAIRTDLAPSRFSTDTTRQMMRVVVRGKEMSKVERKPMNVTFVVDVSGSMREQNRLEMVKHAMRLLVTQLDQYDRIAIVKFSTDAQRVLDLTPVRDRAAIESAIMPLTPEGSTNSNAGLELGYGIAVAGFDPNATNRVVFLSDGVANVGETDPNKIAERVKPMREKGIYLNTIGVGMNNHNDVLLEQLADKADGMCAYIDTPDEAKKQLVDNFSGAFQPIARDVKIQVEFDPRQVLRYRLLGYENRAIADADFRNDKVDAGELGSGHTVTALYEIERQNGVVADGPLATVRVRWKEPSSFGLPSERDTASEVAHTVLATQATTFEGAGQGYRKAVLAAQFAELLRRSVHARGDSVDDLLNEAVKLQKEIPNDKDFTEFVLLVSKAKDAILRTMPVCDELCQAIDQVREFEYRRQQLASLQRELDQKMLDELRQQNDLLEARLREVLRRRLESQGR